MSGLTDIELKDDANYLGIIIDHKLTWTPHIDQLRKLSRSLYVLRRVKGMSGVNKEKTAYFSLFESHVRYGLAIWGNNSIGNLQRVLVLQKKAVGTLAGLDPMATYRKVFQDQNILTVLSLYMSEVICYVVSHIITKLEERHSEHHELCTTN